MTLGSAHSSKAILVTFPIRIVLVVLWMFQLDENRKTSRQRDTVPTFYFLP